MENFRQFVEKTEIQFSEDEHKNITLILGKNGNGKTGIFRAIMFVLYGQQNLPQDNDAATNLVNIAQLEKNEGSIVVATVCLNFEHLGQNYKLTRRIAMRKDNNHYETVPYPRDLSDKEVQLEIGGEGKVITDQNEITFEISQILPATMSEFFFFDGEYRSSLLGDDSEKRNNRNNIKNEIYKMLQIQPLEEAKNRLNNLVNKRQRDIRQATTNAELKQLEEYLAEKKQQKEQKEQTIQNIQENLKLAEQEKREAEKKLQENTEAEQLKITVDRDKELLEERVERKKELLSKTPQFAIAMTKLMIIPMLRRSYQSINEKLSQQEHRIPIDVLQDSLNRNECELCHHSLTDDDRTLIEKLIAQYETKESTKIMQKIVAQYQHDAEQAAECEQQLEQDLRKLAEIDSKIMEAEQRYHQSKQKFADTQFDDQEFNALKESVHQRTHDIESYQAELIYKKAELQKLDEEISKLDKECHEFMKQDEKVNKLRHILEILERFHDTLDKVLTEYKETVLTVLSEKITSLYKQLISEKDRDKVDYIEITTNFDIRFINPYGENVRQDNSQGQNQMLSLAFLLALAEYAREGIDSLSFPLMIDTPFGRLDQENRRNLIHHIPNIASQWILLVTDSELSDYEAECFIEDNRVGKQYLLENNSTGTTVKEKVSVTQLMEGNDK